jgi:hypothetical protein
MSIAPHPTFTFFSPGLLVDGEQAEAAPETEFRLAACEVDLVATEPDGH